MGVFKEGAQSSAIENTGLENDGQKRQDREKSRARTAFLPVLSFFQPILHSRSPQ